MAASSDERSGAVRTRVGGRHGEPSWLDGRWREPAALAADGGWRGALRAAWRPWLAVHGIVGLSLLVVWTVHDASFPEAGSGPGARGLHAWDGGWYRGIALSGYDGVAPEARRFFPLLPLLGRTAAYLVWDAAAVWLVASVCALAYLTAVGMLAERLLHRPDRVGRATWTAALVPGAAALALPYTEALAGLLTVVFLLSLERRRPATSLATGALAALTRPTGALLALPALLARDRGARWPTRVLTVAGPLLGTALLALWSRLGTGDWLAPWSSQTDDQLRGGLLLNPLPGIWRNDSGGITPPVTFLLIGISGWLLVRVLRTLPLAYGAWSAAVLLLSVCSVDSHSLPRYVAGIVPLVLVLSDVPDNPRTMRRLLLASAVLSLVLTIVWIDGRVVP